MLKLIINSSEFVCNAMLNSHTAAPVFVNDFPVAIQHDIQQKVTLYGDGPAAIGGLMNSMQNLLATGASLNNVSYNDGSNDVAHAITAGQTLGGLWCSNFKWTGTEGHLAYEAVAEFTLTYLVAGVAPELIEWTEKISINAEEGAVTVMAPQARKKSIRQTTSLYVPEIVVTQSGRITGRTQPPEIPTPLIIEPGARSVVDTRRSFGVTQKRLAVVGHHLDYSYTFKLAEEPPSILPRFLT